ncbi:hypothetical protein SCAR479_13257 [Seiridium cardinale]|uniref:Uncharacterized protein n=1 Tax=Seiridium cardinale TaxID=138064 RepID=A0ABR2X8I1_9PEZI
MMLHSKSGPRHGMVALLLLATSELATAFGWRSQSRASSSVRDDFEVRPSYSSSQLLNTGQRPLTSYEVALHELQQLESEPVCHRTAARLLINNCQVLDGKDEATILTDSGRQIRDFVDAYAASLSICDLERGGFTISSACDNFKEPVLKQLSLGERAVLHVSSREIDHCLSGLASSDSGWNTWISYRHKALRFCEAARADNEKAEHIRLFQRLTKIMSKMTHGVEEVLDKHMKDFDSKVQLTSDRIDSLSPQLDHINAGLGGLQHLIADDLTLALQKSTDTVNAGTASAVNLQRALEILMQTVLATNAEATSAHEMSIEIVARKADSEFATIMTAMTAAFASAETLQNQIELAHRQSAELETRQAHLEEGMVRLVDVTEVLAKQYDQHTYLLHQAQDMTNEILDTLEDTAASAAIVGDAFAKQSSATSWWPYIWCPAASLVMGSYGLPPSAMRNIALVALGEFAGLMVSFVQLIPFSLPSIIDLSVLRTSTHTASATPPAAMRTSGNFTS